MSPLSVPRKWQLLLTGETGKEEGKKRGGEKGRVCVCVCAHDCVCPIECLEGDVPSLLLINHQLFRGR